MTDAELLETKRTFDQLDEDGMTNDVLFAIQYPQAMLYILVSFSLENRKRLS